MSKILTPFENHLRDAMSNYEAPYDAQGWNDLQKRISGRSGGNGAWMVALFSTVLVLAAGTAAIYRHRNTPAIAELSTKTGRFEKQFQLSSTPLYGSASQEDTYANPGTGTTDLNSDASLSSTQTSSSLLNNPIQNNGSSSTSSINPGSSTQVPGGNSTSIAENTESSKEDEVKFFSDVTKACQGVEVDFSIQGIHMNNEGTQAGKATNYLWNFGDGHFSQAVNPKHKFNKPGNYDVSLSITNEDGQIMTTVNKNMITILQGPDASFEWDFVNESPDNPTVKIINTSEHATSYEWKFSDGSNSQQVSPIRTFDTKGKKHTVALEVRNQEGCTDASVRTISVNAEYNLGAQGSFDPSTETFMPSYLKQNKTNFSLAIFTADGKKVFETTNRSKGWDGKLPDGKIAASNSQYLWKVIITSDNSQEEKYFNGTLTINP